MIVQHDENGRIEHIVFDPVPPELIESYQQANVAFLNFPPVPWPEEQDVNPDTGKPLFDADGYPVMVCNGWDPVPCDIEKDYILDGKIVRRPTFDVPELIEIPADGVTEAVIENLPDPCLIKVDDETTTVTGGRLVIASDMPAEYRIELIQWPYIPATVKVVAHAVDA